jgi:hypothetical protein
MVRHAMIGCALSGLVLVAVQAGGSAKAVKSGPQVGADVPGPFHPLIVTGENAGKKHCLFCENGPNPVAVVFARDVTPQVSALLQKLEEATVANKGKGMGSFAVFCSDASGLEAKLKDVAARKKLENLILSIDNPSGPKGYDISKEADVTVVLYNDFNVKANHAFKKGELREADITRIVADVSKMVTTK